MLMNETRRIYIKCHFLSSLAYAKSHIFDGPMFVKLAMLSLYFYTLVFLITAKILYKAEAEKMRKTNPSSFLVMKRENLK